MSVFGRLFNLGRGVVAQVTKPTDERAAERERIARLEAELRETRPAAPVVEERVVRDVADEATTSAVTPRKRDL
jgi:hypothetical protein